MVLTEWRPIKTAPKDGTEVLGWPAVGRYNMDMPAPMAWDRGVWRMIAGEGDWMDPTHWMPLPAPPSLIGDTPNAGE